MRSLLNLIPALSLALLFLVEASPARAQGLISVTPDVVHPDGSTVITIQGSQIPSRATATIGGKPVTDLDWVSSRTLRGRAPALGRGELPGPRNLAVDFGGRVGVVTLRDAVTYRFPDFQVTSFEPGEVSSLGRTPFQITGDGFTTHTRATLEDGTVLTTEFASSRLLRGSMPAHAPTSGRLALVLRSRAGTEVRLEKAVRFVGPLEVSEVEPSTWPAGATPANLIVRGIGFTPGTTLQLFGTPAGQPLSRNLEEVRWISARELRAPVPDLPPGVYSLAARDLEPTGAVVTEILREAVEVTTAGAPPVLHRVEPFVIPVEGGVPVVIHGERLGGDSQIHFGGSPVVELVVSDDGLSATGLAPSLPDGEAPGLRPVFLQTAAGAAVLRRGVRYGEASEEDGDSDGLGDGEDICPDTAPGARVNGRGCADYQILSSPRLLVEPVMLELDLLVNRFDLSEETADFSPLLLEAAGGMGDIAHLIEQGKLVEALRSRDQVLAVLAETLEHTQGLVDSIYREIEMLPADGLVLNGDINGNGERDLSDIIALLGWLFLGTRDPFPLSCEDPDDRNQNGDANGDGQRDLADVLYLLYWQFQGGAPPVTPCEPTGATPGGDSHPRSGEISSIRMRQIDLVQAWAATDLALKELGQATELHHKTQAVEGVITRIDDADGLLELDGARTLGLFHARTYPDMAVGSRVVVDATNSGDLTGMASSVAIVAEALDDYPLESLGLSQCIQLRVIPVQRLNPQTPSQWLRHETRAYRHEDDIHYLEQGMRLAAELDYSCYFNLPYLDANQYYSPSLKIELEYRPGRSLSVRRQGVVVGPLTRTVTLAEDLKSTDWPVELPGNIAPDTVATLTVTHRQRICDVPLIDFVEPSCTEWGQPTIRTYSVLVKPRGHYARANYSRTIIDLEDSPLEAGWDPAFVTGIETEDIQTDPGGLLSFAAEGYAVNGQQSSRPAVVPIGLGQSFAIYGRDFAFYTPYSQYHTFSRIFDPQSGSWQASGLRWPHVTGFRNGRPFRYSCPLPDVVRDRLAPCFDFDTFYRMPFHPDSGAISMGQANNGGFTHQGGQFFAYDFGHPSGTPIHAPRGGVVRLLCDVNNTNCFDDSLNMCTCASNPIPGSLCRDDAFAGNYFLILHEDGSYSFFAHIRPGGFFVNQGQRVRRGDLLALSDNIGCSSNPHLHYQVNSCHLSFCGNASIPHRYQGLDGEDGEVINCLDPQDGDLLYSNNRPWNE